jgi:molecular chaperone GrpE
MTEQELPPESDHELPPEAENLVQEEPRNEADEYKDKYLRLLAETENTRKRLQKEKQEMMRFSVENVIEEFLTPMDNLENALKHTGGMSPETLNWVRGFEMILSQFKDVLTQNGVSTFNSIGEQFDPHLHEAVEVEELEDCKDGTVLAEFVKGYKSHTRTVRPARVKVAKKKIVKQENETN